jgi:CDP-diacylglycerol--serine O-phosphatidyltransferase
MLNGLFGISAIFLIIFDSSLGSLRFHLAFSFILLGLLADGLDGILARRYGKGELGEYFEAMSDMVTMGVAPIIFIALFLFVTFQMSLITIIVSWMALLFYLFGAFVRLASFHPLKNKNAFLGLPASAATMLVISSTFITNTIEIILLITIIAAILMITPFSFPKPTKIMNMVTLLIVILTIIFGFYVHIMYIFLFISVIIYIIGGQIYLYISDQPSKR